MDKETTLAGDGPMTPPPMTSEREFDCAIAAIASDNTMKILKKSLPTHHKVYLTHPFEVKHVHRRLKWGLTILEMRIYFPNSWFAFARMRLAWAGLSLPLRSISVARPLALIGWVRSSSGYLGCFSTALETLISGEHYLC
jgi:hypothetical protein